MGPAQIQKQRVLISPLNWGWGHVARCIGLVQQLKNQGNEIFIACESAQKDIFIEYFPNVTYIEHEGYPFRFGEKGNFNWDILLRYTWLQNRLYEERRQTEQMVSKYGINVVISDHRYGFRSKYVKSIFVTHQYNLPLKWFELAIARVHKRLMSHFHQIWILDYENSKLAGKLSMSGSDPKAIYIGPFSRYQYYDIPKEKKGGKVLVLSGPLVHAKKLLEKVLLHYSKEELTVIAPSQLDIHEEVTVLHGNWSEQDEAILNASHIISRSGYSTIMDLEYLNCPKVSFFPTPGQREQEYLFDLHKS